MDVFICDLIRQCECGCVCGCCTTHAFRHSCCACEGFSDPYVEIVVRNEKKYATDIKKKTLDPKWVENITLQLPAKDETLDVVCCPHSRCAALVLLLKFALFWMLMFSCGMLACSLRVNFILI